MSIQSGVLVHADRPVSHSLQRCGDSAGTAPAVEHRSPARCQSVDQASLTFQIRAIRDHLVETAGVEVPLVSDDLLLPARWW